MIVYKKSYSAYPKLMLLVAVLIIYTQSMIAQPYFGNGIKNGWADQHSISIWARLTEKPELLKEGKEFLPAKSEEGKEWFEETDISLLENSQIPNGAKLIEMIGACPGANGEIRLTYYPTQDPSARKTVDWQTVDASKNKPLKLLINLSSVRHPLLALTEVKKATIMQMQTGGMKETKYVISLQQENEYTSLAVIDTGNMQAICPVPAFGSLAVEQVLMRTPVAGRQMIKGPSICSCV
jgi:hypothetical protein